MINTPVEKNKDYVVKIDNLGYEGEGVGRINNFTIFVPAALPGEEVEVRIIKVNKNFAFGRLLKVIASVRHSAQSQCAA